MSYVPPPPPPPPPVTPPPPNPFGADGMGASQNGHHHGNLARQIGGTAASYAAPVILKAVKEHGPRIGTRIIKSMFRMP